MRESLRVFGLDEGDASTMESALARDTSKEKVQKTKKGKKGATLKKPAARGTSQAKSPQKVERKQAHSTFRHRMTSSAYHKARVLAKQQGMSPESSKRMAREASRKAAAEIDAGILTERSQRAETDRSAAQGKECIGVQSSKHVQAVWGTFVTSGCSSHMLQPKNFNKTHVIEGTV